MKILNPPVKLCTEILEFLYVFSSRKKECKIEVLKKHFDVTPNYWDRAFSFLTDNNLILSTSSESVSLSPEVFDQLEKSTENSKEIVLEQLMKVQPFIEFTYFLGKGKSEKESIKLVTSLYDLHQGEETILKIFKEWIKISGINILKNRPKSKALDELKDSLQNKLYANNFIKEFLGNNLRKISEQVITELSDAVKEIPEDNEASVNEAGRALEDFLRIDLAQDIDLTHCSGIAEIGSELNKHGEYPKKLNNLCIGLSSVRSMGKAHGSDRTLKVKWDVTDHSAIGYIIIVLSVIKSYLIFRQRNKLIF